MQGYILNITKVKEEDLLVTLLTPTKLKTLYRFYGARHSTINLGYKIDFETQSSAKSTLAMLRQVLHLSQKWQLDPKRFYLWQQFIKLLYQHLKDVEEIESFYMQLLDTMSLKFARQNPLRIFVESYVELLAFEGRLHDDFICFICDTPIQEEMVLARGFVPAHTKCLSTQKVAKKKIALLFEQKKSLFLDDTEVERLWHLIEEGL